MPRLLAGILLGALSLPGAPAALFDRRMTELVKAGRLRQYFARWKQPYPFDKDSETPDESP